jgi:hypothetical protein
MCLERGGGSLPVGPADNKEILAFLLENQRRIGEDKLSLRMFCKAQELYVSLPEDWRDYVEDMLFTKS